MIRTYYDSNTRREREKEIREEEIKGEESKEQKKYGTLANVMLTNHQHQHVSKIFENPRGLIDKVSTIIANAKPKNDHYAYIIKVANEDNWPKRRHIGSEPETSVKKEEMSPELRELMNKNNITKKM